MQTANEVALPEPHSPGQREIITFRGSVAVFAGRRWGKTEAGVQRILRACAQNPGLYWWVGLNWKSASMKRAWRLLKSYTRQIYAAAGLPLGKNIREADKEIYLPNGAIIWLRTAEKPESLAGEGVLGVVGDEFSLWKPNVWSEYLEATLLDHGGWVMFIGVPKGRDWAAEIWEEAASRDGWRQFHFTTYENPILDPKAIDEIREHVTERTFRQEYLAEVLSDGGAVFRKIMDAVWEPPHAPEKGMAYFMGVDWAQVEDWTVLTVIDHLGRVVDIDRFNQISWEFQRDRLKAMARKWRVQEIVAELNSIGSPNVEALQAEGLPVTGFYTTATSKERVIQSLALAFEQGAVRIPKDDELIRELQAFTATRTARGWKYEAPSGMHDDMVISLALALEAIGREAEVGPDIWG